MKTKTVPAWTAWLFFLIGVFSAVAFRAVLIISRLSPGAGRFIWYAGIIGYLLFFGFRYLIALKRRRMILSNNLIEKLEQGKCSPEERKQLLYLCRSLVRSREMINYILIFIFSIVAVVTDLIMAG